LNNIAFELFLDIVQWFDKDESRQVRYSPSTLQFCWLGRKLFGGRFERYFFNKLGVLVDGDFKFGVLLLVFVLSLTVIQAIS
jgi:hypothetical protein